MGKIFAGEELKSNVIKLKSFPNLIQLILVLAIYLTKKYLDIVITSRWLDCW